MRIGLVNISPGISERFSKTLDEVAHKVCHPSTKVTVMCLNQGTNRMSDQVYEYTHMLTGKEIVEKFVQAEREGYDACITDWTEDVAVREGREVVNIPIVAPMASAMSHAILLGDKFGIVTMNVLKSVRQFEDIIRRYGLENRVIAKEPVRGVDLSSTHEAVSKSFDDPRIIVEAVKEKAQELIKDGAEVIIIGNGAYGPFCTVSGLTSLEDGQVPILDPISIALKNAETIVDLKNSIGLPSSSRACGCMPMPDKDIEKVRRYFGLT